MEIKLVKKELTKQDYDYMNIPSRFRDADKVFVETVVSNYNEFKEIVGKLLAGEITTVILIGDNDYNKSMVGCFILKIFRRRYYSCLYANQVDLAFVENDFYDNFYVRDIVFVDGIGSNLTRNEFGRDIFKGIVISRLNNFKRSIYSLSGISLDDFLKNTGLKTNDIKVIRV